MSIRVYSKKLADVRLGTTVVVLGTGPVSLLTVAVAHTFGAKDIVFPMYLITNIKELKNCAIEK